MAALPGTFSLDCSCAADARRSRSAARLLRLTFSAIPYVMLALSGVDTHAEAAPAQPGRIAPYPESPPGTFPPAAPPPAAQPQSGTSPAQTTPSKHQADIARALIRARRFDDLRIQTDIALRDNLRLADGSSTLRAIYAGLAFERSTMAGPPTQVYWDSLDRVLAEWRIHSPSAVMPELLTATALISRAWHARGTRFAKEVTEAQWKEHFALLDQAEQRLGTMRPETKAHPEWTLAMLEIGIAKNWDVERFLRVLREGIERHPLYEPLYLAGAVRFAPQWGGSTELLKVYAQQMRDAMGPRHGEIMYTRIYSVTWYPTMFTEGEVDWPRMRAGFQRLIEAYPAQFNYNQYARFACLAGDGPAFQEANRNIGEQMMAAWGPNLAPYLDCVTKAQNGTLQPVWK